MERDQKHRIELGVKELPKPFDLVRRQYLVDLPWLFRQRLNGEPTGIQALTFCPVKTSPEGRHPVVDRRRADPRFYQVANEDIHGGSANTARQRVLAKVRQDRAVKDALIGVQRGFFATYGYVCAEKAIDELAKGCRPALRLVGREGPL